MSANINLNDAPKGAIRRIAQRHGAVQVQVFGSRSIGQGTEASDIGLLVDLEKGRDLLDLIAIKQDIESELDCAVDVITRNGLIPYLKDRILSEAKPL